MSPRDGAPAPGGATRSASLLDSSHAAQAGHHEPSPGSRAGEPGVGIDVAVSVLARRHDVATPAMARLRHDARIVPASGKQEGQLVVGEELNLVDRAPGGDVVGLGADHEHRRSMSLSAITLPSTA